MPGRQAVRASLLLIFVLLVAGCAAVERPFKGSAALGPGNVYDRSGDNSPEIGKFLSRYPEGSEMRRAADFLAANLPLSDALAMDAEDLAEHIEYAFLARDSTPWGRDVPFDVFLRFVVPHRMSQEPVQPYRARFYAELVPRLKGVKTMREAVRRVNEWCFEKARFEPSSSHDQGPLTTIARGKGRCEELGILLVSALRSVGVPARPCSAPWWRRTDGNHLWVEVYDQGKWRFIGAGEIESDYDLAWFEPALHTAPFLYSTAYGNSTLGLEGDGPATIHRRDTLINRTAAYAPKGELEVSITLDGKPAPDVFATLYAYNFAAPRPIVRTKSDENGSARIEAGTGVFLVIATTEAGRDHAFVEIGPGKRTGARLDLARGRLFEGGAFMPFETDPNLEKIIRESYREARDKAAKRAKHIDRKRKQTIASIVSAAARAADQNEKMLAGALAGAGLNAPEIARALIAAPEDIRPDLLQLIRSMDAKDLAECRAKGLIENADLAAAARSRLEKNGVLDYNDKIFKRYVLPERILHEPFSHWRPGLSERFRKLKDAKNLDAILYSVSSAAARLEPVEPSMLGCGLTPEQVFSSGDYREGTRDAQVAAVAALRAAGVPSRGLEDWPWAEYFDGREWLPFHAWTNKPPEGLSAYYEPWAELAVTFTLNGEPVSPESLQYALDFAVLRFDETRGLVGLDAVKVRKEKDNGRVLISFPAGERWLSSGRRDGGGRPYVRLERVLTLPGERLEMTRELALPENPSIPPDAFRP